MNAKAAMTALLLGMMLFAPVAAADDEPETEPNQAPCNAVDVTTYDPYVTVYWRCIDELLPTP